LACQVNRQTEPLHYFAQVACMNCAFSIFITIIVIELLKVFQVIVLVLSIIYNSLTLVRIATRNLD